MEVRWVRHTAPFVVLNHLGLKQQQKKRPFQKSFRGNPLKAEISNTSGSKQALETSSTRHHKILWPSFAKTCSCCLSSTLHF